MTHNIASKSRSQRRSPPAFAELLRRKGAEPVEMGRVLVASHDLAQQTEQIERRADLSPQQARDLVLGFIGSRYTLPE